MKFNNKEEIKNILNLDIKDEEKKNMIANLKNTKTNLSRIINLDYELELEEGQVWNNRNEATSWADGNSGKSFETMNQGSVDYLLVAKNVEGYKVQYFDFNKMFDDLYIDLGEDEAERIAEELSEDEVYIKLMELLGADGAMEDESEVLVSKETELIIKEINDVREDIGYIEIILQAK